MTRVNREEHLEADEVAALIDGTLDGDARATVESHLASCPDCRAEVVAVSSIVRMLPAERSVRRRVWLPATVAAVAAALLVAVWPRPTGAPESPVHREEAVTTTVAPRPLAPVGVVRTTTPFVWSSVPYADRYHVRLFDPDGMVIWEVETTDTVATPPASVITRERVSYFWRVEAATGFDRRAASSLVNFVRAEQDRR